MFKRIMALLVAGLMLWSGCAMAETGAEPVQTADFSEKFADRFLAEGEEPVADEMSYRSRDVSIEIKTYREMNSDVYVADIYLRHLSDLRRGFGGGRWKSTNQEQQRVVDLALQEDAILALTGDNAQNFSAGIVYANGVRYRKTNPKRQMCVIFADGEMRTYASKEITMKKLEATGKAVWQTFLFGPSLLEADGSARKKITSQVATENPRAAIGYFEPGHYCLVQVDGRGVKSALEAGKRSKGFTLVQLAAFMEKLGCKVAYNLDGGQSALMWFNGRIVSTPYKNGRKVGDIVYIARTASGTAEKDAAKK